MKILTRISSFYYFGFKNMRLGRSLWLVIIVKLFIIFGILKVFIYDNSLHKLYATQEEKSQFITHNLKNY
ncbi:DUF4492 domain-containing protein [Helicobacter apodemus]|uniref:DUF4492 domain-containing protein n=1 Tax=Helicobacter apodemus TaxID=135569 RepID=A0A2U8FFC5_9HELI|nr:DUF4492 domain-containing protein [Helicobacter apodemus]AWI34991.1 DUF4492 domain-containing protein [Helicobacter apodemus]